MDRTQFTKKLNQNLDLALSIIEKKNHDYATSADPFANFRNCELAGYRVEDGIYIRLLDKVARIGNFLRFKRLVVKGESIEDTLIDLINYTNILLTYLQGQEEEFVLKMRDEAEKMDAESVNKVKENLHKNLDIGGIPDRHSMRLAVDEAVRNLNS